MFPFLAGKLKKKKGQLTVYLQSIIVSVIKI